MKSVFETTNDIQDDINSLPIGMETGYSDYGIHVKKTEKGTTITISGEQHFAENANALRPYIRTQVKSALEDMNKKTKKEKTMKNAQEFVDFEIKKAKAKHPFFPCGSSGLSIIVEEVGELAAAINDFEDKYRQIEEAAHVAVTAIRFIDELLKDDQSR